MRKGQEVLGEEEMIRLIPESRREGKKSSGGDARWKSGKSARRQGLNPGSTTMPLRTRSGWEYQYVQQTTE